MKKLENTQYFKIQSDQELKVGEVLRLVYQAMTEKGYDPVNQIVGYIMSGDPTYITSHKGARSLIMKVERDELVEELLRVYVEKTVKDLAEYEDYGTGLRLQDRWSRSQ